MKTKAPTYKMGTKRGGVKQPQRGLKSLKRSTRRRMISIVDWRRTIRPAILRKATTATKGLDWSPALFAALLEELGEDDRLESLLGPVPKDLDVVAYPQAIALVLILRDSWQPHHLRRILESLELIDGNDIGQRIGRAKQ